MYFFFKQFETDIYSYIIHKKKFEKRLIDRSTGNRAFKKEVIVLKKD